MTIAASGHRRRTRSGDRARGPVRRSQPPGFATQLKDFLFRIVLTALALTLVACSAVINSEAPGVDVKPATTETVWEYPASEFPAMCISLKQDGKLEFKGGFLFFSPGIWRIEPVTGNTELTLGGAAPFPEMSAKEERQDRTSGLIKFDGKARKLEYRIDSQTGSIGFGGFIFYKTAGCSAAR